MGPWQRRARTAAGQLDQRHAGAARSAELAAQATLLALAGADLGAVVELHAVDAQGQGVARTQPAAIGAAIVGVAVVAGIVGAGALAGTLETGEAAAARSVLAALEWITRRRETLHDDQRAELMGSALWIAARRARAAIAVTVAGRKRGHHLAGTAVTVARRRAVTVTRIAVTRSAAVAITGHIAVAVADVACAHVVAVTAQGTAATRTAVIEATT